MSETREFKYDGKEYFVKKPNSKVSQEGQRIYSSEFMRCLKDGLMVKASLKKFLKEHGVWNDAQEAEEKDISRQINELEIEIYKGGKDRKSMTLQEGKAKAIKMKELRNRYAVLISERQSYEANTAESVADNARFDFLVSECAFNKDGTKVYNSYEDYQNRSGDELAYEAASSLAQLLYALEEDYAKKLPENQFLLRFGLVDEELRLINSDGHLVDRDGRLINDEGYYVDKDGNRVDRDGNRLTKDGLLDFEVTFTDEDGNPVEPKGVKAPKEEVKEVAEVSVVEEPTVGELPTVNAG